MARRAACEVLASLDRHWLAEIFDRGAKRAAHPLTSPASGFSYRPLRRGASYFVEELVLGAGGAIVQSRLQPISHALSAGRYGMAFYFRRGGRLYQAPLGYYAQAQRWDLDPGAVDGNPRFSKSLRSFCISCHSEIFSRRRAVTDQVFIDPTARRRHRYSRTSAVTCRASGTSRVCARRTSSIRRGSPRRGSSTFARNAICRELRSCAREASEFGFRPGGDARRRARQFRCPRRPSPTACRAAGAIRAAGVERVLAALGEQADLHHLPRSASQPRSISRPKWVGRQVPRLSRAAAITAGAEAPRRQSDRYVR